MKLDSKNDASFKCIEEINLLKFCPNPTCNNYLIVVTSSKLILLEVNIEENNDEKLNITFSPVIEIILREVIDLSWSPATNLTIAPKHLRLFLACFDNSVVYLSSDLKGSIEQLLVGKHKSFVNAIACNPENYEQIVSTGDDCEVNIWAVGSGVVKRTGNIHITTAGMAVSFHPHESDKIMVAEKNGIIRFFTVSSLQSFLSIDCCRQPLSSASWSLSNPNYIAVISATEFLLFNTSQSSQSILSRELNHNVGGKAICCHTNDNFVATLGKLKSTIHILNVKNLENIQVLHSLELQSCKSFDFHHRLPILFFSSFNKIQYKIFTKIA